MSPRRRKAERVGDGRMETKSAKVALGRLVAAVATHGVEIIFNPTDGKYDTMTLYRPDKAPVEYGARKAEYHLTLLAEFAHVGLKMSWQEIREVTGWTSFNT